MPFPTVEGFNLAGRRFVLPKDFEGGLNAVLLAFEIEHQADVDTWLPFLKRLLGEHTELRYYELPILWTTNSIRRWMIDSGMRSGIPDQRTRELTITLYLDRRAFLRELGLPRDDQIYVLLVDQSGNVLWCEVGRFTAQKAQSMTEALAQRSVGVTDHIGR